jgi:hypothetical protein
VTARELVSLGVVANDVSHGSEDEHSESSGGSRAKEDASASD